MAPFLIERRIRIMHRNVKPLILGVFGALAAIAYTSWGAPIACVDERLTDEHRKQLALGNQVFLTEEVPGKPWPRTMVFKQIAATPEEAAAVFHDAARQKDYLRNHDVMNSTAEPIPNSRKVKVGILVRIPVPFVPNEQTYEIHSVSQIDQGFRIDWECAKKPEDGSCDATSTKSIAGHVCFKASGTGTLMAYTNLVEPGGGIAGFGPIKNTAMGKVRETQAAIAREIERVRRDDRALIEREIRVLRQRLD